MALMQVTVGAIEYGLFAHDMYADLRPLVQLFGEQWLLALLVVGVGAPLSEELLFRGFLLSALARSRLGFAGGAVITTAWWTALHAGYSAVRHHRGVPDRPVLLVAAVADRQPARAHLLPRAL